MSNVLSITSIKQCDNIASLKASGSFATVKQAIADSLSIPMKVRSWQALHDKLQTLMLAVQTHREFLTSHDETQDLSVSLLVIKQKLGTQLTVSDMTHLTTAINKLLVFFTDPKLSAYELYEQYKRENFVHSSRLEGIHMPMQKPESSLADVLAKYRAA
jgi:hypothetical protein